MGMGTSTPPVAGTTPTTATAPTDAAKQDGLTNNQKLAMQIMAQQFQAMGNRGAGPGISGIAPHNVAQTQTMQGGTHFDPSRR